MTTSNDERYGVGYLEERRLAPRWPAPVSHLVNLVLLLTVFYVTWWIFQDPRGVMRLYTPYVGYMYTRWLLIILIWMAYIFQFWPMHRRLFGAPLDRATLKGHAEALGLDVPRFLEDLDLGTFSGPRVRHRREAVELGIYFGPVALVNGRPVVGFRDERAWHDLLEEEILAAQTRLRDGTPRADLYASFQAGALLAPIELEPAAEAARQQLAGRFAVDIKTLPADFQRVEAGKRYMVEAGDAPALGPVDAPVQLVAFMDFECPYCRRAAQEGFQELRRRYPEDLRLAFRHLPLPIHRSADGAARAAVAAERDL